MRNRRGSFCLSLSREVNLCTHTGFCGSSTCGILVTPQLCNAVSHRVQYSGFEIPVLILSLKPSQHSVVVVCSHNHSVGKREFANSAHKKDSRRSQLCWIKYSVYFCSKRVDAACFIPHGTLIFFLSNISFWSGNWIFNPVQLCLSMSLVLEISPQGDCSILALFLWNTK